MLLPTGHGAVRATSLGGRPEVLSALVAERRNATLAEYADLLDLGSKGAESPFRLKEWQKTTVL